VHGLTNDAGNVTIRLPAEGRWSVVVRRIGLEPRSTAVHMVRDGDVARSDVRMRSAQFTLRATRCHVKIFLDGERVSAMTLGTVAGSVIGGSEFYPRPRKVPDGLRRAGNVCGTVLLWRRER